MNYVGRAQSITLRDQFVMGYGGLRGAIAFALAFVLVDEKFVCLKDGESRSSPLNIQNSPPLPGTAGRCRCIGFTPRPPAVRRPRWRCNGALSPPQPLCLHDDDGGHVYGICPGNEVVSGPLSALITRVSAL